MKKKYRDWFMLSKALLRCERYRKLNSHSFRVLMHLFSCYDTFLHEVFYQKMDVLSEFTGLSKKQIRGTRKELQEFGVIIFKKGNYWYYDMCDVYKRYMKEVPEWEGDSHIENTLPNGKQSYAQMGMNNI